MKQNLHFLPAELRERKDPESLGMVYTSVQRHELDGSLTIDAAGEETLLVVIAGSVGFECDGSTGSAVERDMLYVPLGSAITLDSRDAVVMQFGAPCERSTAFAHVEFSVVDADARHNVYGDTQIGTRRDVWNMIDESFDSPRFLAGLCTGRDGGWTAWPPHEHGDKREETYVYFGMGDSFGAQFVYDDDGMDNPHAVALVREGHVVSVPRGYHPSCGSPAGAISYAYVMVSITPEDRNFMDLTIQSRYGEVFD